MSTFLGWMLGKSMLENRGFFWAWFIHFVQDVLVSSFMVVGTIAPGGCIISEASEPEEITPYADSGHQRQSSE
jgi:hypothetical protein